MNVILKIISVVVVMMSYAKFCFAVGQSTALMEAISQGQIAVVQRLLENKADPNQSTRTTPLQLAVCCNQPEVVRLLIATGATLDKATADMKETPLMLAAFLDYPKIVENLLASGADKSLVVDGKTAVDLAPEKSPSRAMLEGKVEKSILQKAQQALVLLRVRLLTLMHSM